MATNRVQKVREAIVYVDGNDLMGCVEELDIPALEATTTEHDTISSIGSFETPAGFNPLSLRFKWKSPGKDVFAISSDMYTQRNLQVRSNIEDYTGTPDKVDKPLITFLRGRFTSSPSLNFSPKTDVDSESTFSASYIRQEVDGVTTLEYDSVNSIYKVNGKDLLVNRNRNLGIR